MQWNRQPKKLIATLAGLGLMAVAPSGSLAATLTVGSAAQNDHTTIQAAIEAAVNGDEVLVSPGTYTESIDFLTKSIVVRGDAGAENTFLVGTGGTVVLIGALAGASTILDGFDISGGDSRTTVGRPGGCIHVEGSSPGLRNLVLHDCSARLGGGMQLIASGARVENVRIVDTVAEADGDEWGLGGGLYLLGGAPVLSSVTIEDTTARVGGAVFAQSSPMTVVGMTIRGAVADSTGGVHIAGDGTPNPAVLEDVTITGCIANEGAGGLRTQGGGRVTIRDSTVTDNSAQRGGGMRFSGGDFSVLRTLIARNTATSAAGGGGLRIDDGAVGTCDRCVVAANEAEFGAGALVDDASPTFVRSRFASNRAEGDDSGFGGGLYALSSDVAISTTLFDGNRAGRDGGAIRVEGSGISRVSSSLFVHNRAEAGAGAHILSGALDLSHVTFAGDRADSGAVLRVTADGSLSLLNSIVALPQRGDGVSASTGAVTSLRFSDVHVPEGLAWAGDLGDLTGTNGNIEADPQFLEFSPGSNYDDRLVLQSSSVAVNAGDPDGAPDQDGSVAELGAFGGPDGGTWEDIDADGDGWSLVLGDCDDEDPARHPGVEDACEGTDEDCDYQVDEDCGPGDDDDVAGDDDDAVDRNPYIPPSEDNCGCTTAPTAGASGSCLLGLFVYLFAARRRRRA